MRPQLATDRGPALSSGLSARQSALPPLVNRAAEARLGLGPAPPNQRNTNLTFPKKQLFTRRRFLHKKSHLHHIRIGWSKHLISQYSMGGWLKMWVRWWLDVGWVFAYKSGSWSDCGCGWEEAGSGSSRFGLKTSETPTYTPTKPRLKATHPPLGKPSYKSNTGK